MSKTVKENLIAAKALIDTPEKWCKGRRHVFYGYTTPHGAVIVKKYCAEGAMDAVGGLSPERQALLNQTPRAYGNVAEFNDSPDTTHADIMALFQRAIAACPDP